MTTPYQKLVLDLANADPEAGADAPERVRLREYLEEHPEKLNEVLTSLEAWALSDDEYDEVVADPDTDQSSTENSSTAIPPAADKKIQDRPPVIGRIGKALAAAAVICLCVGIWWVVTQRSTGTPYSVPAVQIVELAPLDTDAWQPFSLERKVLPANHAYRLKPVEIAGHYLAIIDSNGATLTPLADVADDDWVVRIRGKEGGAASLLFVGKPAEMDESDFRRTVEARLASVPSAPTIKPGLRLAYTADGAEVESAGGVSLGSPDDPQRIPPEWSTKLTEQLKADGIQISGWTFPLSEE